MVQSVQKRSGISTFWWVLGFSILVFILFYLFEPERAEIPQQQLPWNSQFDELGKLHALGLVLDQTSARQAMQLYEDDYEVRVFSDKDESNKSTEIQFPKIRIGSIQGALFLKLTVPMDELDQIYSRGVETTVTQGGQREVTPFTDDIERLKEVTFNEMTFIPRKNLNERALQMRFGKPDQIETTEDDFIQRWIYQQKGLVILFNSEGPEAFLYQTEK